ncbi:MAG: radical SAM protein [Deltaproteobacteria bacterium]|nr:radical SAM protein [Deltaproteobacteria bacterium]
MEHKSTNNPGHSSRPKVVIIANYQPLDNDAYIHKRIESDIKRGERISAKFPSFDYAGTLKEVHKNLLGLVLKMDGRYVDLLDLMNFLRNDHEFPSLTPDNASRHYSLANTVTLNGIYLYQYLRRAGYDPVIIQNYTISDIEKILEQDPLAVCISSTFMYLHDIKEIGRHVKKSGREIPVIAGGVLIKRILDPGDGLSPQALKTYSSFHNIVDAFVIEAQGEQTLIKLLNSIRDRKDLGSVPNLALFDGGGNMVFTPREQEDLPLDKTAIDWQSIPKDYLSSTLPVSTSRGCFYRCKFCTYHWLFPEVTYKSLDVLHDELKRIKELALVKHVRFTDDNFTANKVRLKKVLEMMLQESFGFSWSCYARVSALTPELLKLMKQAGCVFMDLGIESGSQPILDNMDKRLNKGEALETIKMINDQGIVIRGSFIIGYPGETEATFNETVDFIIESKMPYFQPYLFTYSNRALVNRESEQFKLEGLGLSWQHATMNAVEASILMSQMIKRIPTSYTDGQTSIEEINKLLLGKGYSHAQIRELFAHKRELYMETFNSAATKPFSPKVMGILKDMESLVVEP